MIVERNVNFDMKDMINANNCVNTINKNGQASFTVTGFLIGTNEGVDVETGENVVKRIGVLKTTEGMLSTISPTVIDSMISIIDGYQTFNKLEDIPKGIEVKILSSKSSKAREFFYLGV